MHGRLAILVGPKGRGSNMLAIARACAAGRLDAEVRTVIAPNATSRAVEAARELGLRIDVIEPGEDYGARLLAALRDAGVPSLQSAEAIGIVCLAGFLRLLPVEVLEAYPRRVLNVHPALLPRHGGRGMYGIRVHEAVLASGDTESGASVHFVTEKYDDGDVIVQRRCSVEPEDTPDVLAARVLGEEHLAYIEALQKVLQP